MWKVRIEEGLIVDTVTAPRLKEARGIAAGSIYHILLLIRQSNRYSYLLYRDYFSPLLPCVIYCSCKEVLTHDQGRHHLSIFWLRTHLVPGADDASGAVEGHGLVREETPVPLLLNGSYWLASSPRDLVRGEGGPPGGQVHPDWLLDGEGRLDLRENAEERQG